MLSSVSDKRLAAAILRTLLYADVFQFPMTDREIHHFLIGVSASAEDVRCTLNDSRWLAELIDCGDGYWSLKGNAIGGRWESRRVREQASAALWPVAVRYGQRLAHIPFVRMVALTGALAMHNVHSHGDDIDYLLVTTPGRVWLTRLLVIAVVRAARQHDVKLCPNYVLAQSALAQTQRDLYIAHETAQMIPLAGLNIYAELRAANGWTNAFLPNATTPFYLEADRRPQGFGRAAQRSGELALNGKVGHALERWEQRRKLRKFAAAAQTPHASAQLDAERVKGHFKDYGYPTLQRYYERLRDYGIDP